MADSAEERKHQPSFWKRREARRSGKVATSRDLSSSVGFLAATGALVGVGSAILARLGHEITNGIARIGQGSRHDITGEDLTTLLLGGGLLIAITVGPIACAAAGSGVLTTLVQTSFHFSVKRLELHWDRLSPSNGLKKLAPKQAGIETLKSLLTGAVLAYLTWRLSRTIVTESMHFIGSEPITAMTMGWQELIRLLWQCGFALLVIGAIDHGVQRWLYTESLKMTLQEVKDENKAQEGKPEIKARIAKIRRDLFRKRMMQAVPTATVVITNPTHFAVALEYNRAKSAAPIVVAKGADLVAAKIREIARSHSVPIIENPPLARALFKECELGDTIPGPLFNAVAEVLAYLIRIKQLVL